VNLIFLRVIQGDLVPIGDLHEGGQHDVGVLPADVHLDDRQLGLSRERPGCLWWSTSLPALSYDGQRELHSSIAALKRLLSGTSGPSDSGTS
jgi:hypothetical protein